jgi:hypothetical protein
MHSEVLLSVYTWPLWLTHRPSCSWSEMKMCMHGVRYSLLIHALFFIFFSLSLMLQAVFLSSHIILCKPEGHNEILPGIPRIYISHMDMWKKVHVCVGKCTEWNPYCIKCREIQCEDLSAVAFHGKVLRGAQCLLHLVTFKTSYVYLPCLQSSLFGGVSLEYSYILSHSAETLTP